MEVNFMETIKAPFEDKNWIIKFIIGSVLYFIPIVNFLVVGYQVQYLEKNLKKSAQNLPEWDNWGNLFLSGLLCCVIFLLYHLIALIPAIFTGVLAGVLHSGSMQGPVSLLVILIAILLLFLGLMVSMFFAPIAIIRWVKEGYRFQSAFEILEIWQMAIDNIKDYIIAGIILFGICIIIGVLSMIPILGILIMIVGGFYLMLIAVNIFGNIFSSGQAVINQ